MAKKDLQKRATELGIEYTAKTTVAELEDLIAKATSAGTPGELAPSTDGICGVCGRPGTNHVHTNPAAYA